MPYILLSISIQKPEGVLKMILNSFEMPKNLYIPLFTIKELGDMK